MVRIAVADGDTHPRDSDNSLVPCHHPRVGRNPWGVQMSNGATARTHAFKKKEAACTAHCTTANKRCRRRRPRRSHLDPTLGLNIARMLQAWHAYTNLPGRPTWSHITGPVAIPGGPTYSFSQPRRKAAGEGMSQRDGSYPFHFFLGADKSLWKSGSV